MKRRISLIAFVFLILTCSAFSQTVYVTKSGKKYHNENCRYLTNGTVAIDLSEAANRGYSPCKVCKPPQSDFILPYDGQDDNNDGYDKKDSQEKVQCSVTTKSGNRCKRMTKSSNGKCWQHGGINN